MLSVGVRTLHYHFGSAGPRGQFQRIFVASRTSRWWNSGFDGEFQAVGARWPLWTAGFTWASQLWASQTLSASEGVRATGRGRV